MTKKVELVFAPGCFDDFDGTEEELQELIAELRQMAEDGSLMENSRPLSFEEEQDILERVEGRNSRQ
jgi:hypothetical protein